MNKTHKLIVSALLIVLALFSMIVLTKIFTSPDTYAKSIASLDAKKITVMELAAASTAASAAITIIPGDTATPIANELADFSSDFLIVIGAIYLEKFLLTISGYATFRILLPLACVLLGINLFLKNDSIKKVIIKTVILGLAISLVVPLSVMTSDFIEKTYSTSIAETIDAARQTTEDAASGDEEKGFLSGVVSKVADGVSNITTTAGAVVNSFIEALAVMIITTCVLPLCVLFFFLWVIKIVLGISINLPQRHFRKSRQDKTNTTPIELD